MWYHWPDVGAGSADSDTSISNEPDDEVKKEIPDEDSDNESSSNSQLSIIEATEKVQIRNGTPLIVSIALVLVGAQAESAICCKKLWKFPLLAKILCNFIATFGQLFGKGTEFRQNVSENLSIVAQCFKSIKKFSKFSFFWQNVENVKLMMTV